MTDFDCTSNAIIVIDCLSRDYIRCYCRTNDVSDCTSSSYYVLCNTQVISTHTLTHLQVINIPLCRLVWWSASVFSERKSLMLMNHGSCWRYWYLGLL